MKAHGYTLKRLEKELQAAKSEKVREALQEKIKMLKKQEGIRK